MEKVKVVMESLNLEPCLQGTDGTIFSDLPLYEHRGPCAPSPGGGAMDHPLEFGLVKKRAPRS